MRERTDIVILILFDEFTYVSLPWGFFDAFPLSVIRKLLENVISLFHWTKNDIIEYMCSQRYLNYAI